MYYILMKYTFYLSYNLKIGILPKSPAPVQYPYLLNHCYDYIYQPYLTMETVGVEPASKGSDTQASTRVDCLLEFRVSLCRQSRRPVRYPENLFRLPQEASRRIPLKLSLTAATWAMELQGRFRQLTLRMLGCCLFCQLLLSAVYDGAEPSDAQLKLRPPLSNP